MITRVLGLDENTNFEYDKLSRLIEWKSIDLKSNVTYKETFMYDKASNRIKLSSNVRQDVEYKIGPMGKLVENYPGIKYVYDNIVHLSNTDGLLLTQKNALQYDPYESLFNTNKSFY